MRRQKAEVAISQKGASIVTFVEFSSSSVAVVSSLSERILCELTRSIGSAKPPARESIGGDRFISFMALAFDLSV
jgi:hypothetical protein